MDYNKIIILLIAIILIIIVAGTVFLMNPSKEESKIVVLSNDTLHAGNTFSVALRDLNENPIANENLTIEIRDNTSRVVITEQLTTNNDGNASLELNNISSGNYFVSITFDGNDKYKESNLTYNLRIVDIVVDVISSDPTVPDVDEGAFYSQQSGRTFYTGDVNLAPDGHHWRHLGNNQWERID